MRGREHILIGAGTTALAIGAIQCAGAGFELGGLVPATLAAAAGSLAPDVDHPWSLASLTLPTTAITYSGVFLVARWYEAGHPAAFRLGLTGLGPEWVVGAWTCLGVGMAVFVTSILLGAAFGHRGPVHSFAFGAAATLLVLLGLAVFRAPLWLSLFFAWGWIAHLAADALTPQGVPQLLWPLGHRVGAAGRPTTLTQRVVPSSGSMNNSDGAGRTR